MPAHIEITLPISGRAAVIRRPSCRDMVEADRLAGEGAGSITAGLALFSRVTSIDGRTLPFEDFQELDMADIRAIMAVRLDGEPVPFGPGAPPPTSSSPSQN